MSSFPYRGPFRENALVERHTDGVHLVDGAVEVRLEVAVCTKRFANMASATVFGVQLDWLEIVHIL